MSWRRARVVGALLGLLAAWPATAGAQCSISTQGGVSFGTYDVFDAAPLDSTGSIAYRCGNKDKDIRITLGRGASPTYRPRTLVNGSERLAYNLFMDAAATSIWGDDTEGTSSYFIHNPRNNVWLTLTIYARVPPGQDVAAGSYSDTITVDINF
ncbi:MAG: spore coat protein U domain-containing protein [Acidobacteria bacterium]|nr:spore coat protein U domain-containing protein [Acidobacteriota bacterium]